MTEPRAERTPSRDLAPGTRLRHKDGAEATLDRRKKPSDHDYGYPFQPGWWLTRNDGGLADRVIDAENSDWEVLDA